MGRPRSSRCTATQLWKPASTSRCASGSEDATVILWDVATGRARRTLKGHGGEIDCIAYRPDGKWLASGSKDRSIKLWDVDAGETLRTLTGHADRVESVTFSADGKTLATGSGGKDGTVRLWNVADGARPGQ